MMKPLPVADDISSSGMGGWFLGSAVSASFLVYTLQAHYRRQEFLCQCDQGER